MNLALSQNDRYHHYISAIWEGPLHVTAKLTEMVQYQVICLLQNFDYAPFHKVYPPMYRYILEYIILA